MKNLIQVAIRNLFFQLQDFKKFLKRQHVVFCGTEVLQGKNSSGAYCKAVVIRTGKVVITFYSVRCNYVALISSHFS